MRAALEREKKIILHIEPKVYKLNLRIFFFFIFIINFFNIFKRFFCSTMSTLSVQNLTLSSQIIELAQLGEHTPNLRPNTIQNTAAIKSPELASIILAGIVFAGSLATALCVVCVRYKR